MTAPADIPPDSAWRPAAPGADAALLERLQTSLAIGEETIWKAMTIAPIQKVDLRAAIAKIERLTEERDGLREMLREVSDKGLIYWEPQTTSGAVNRALMFAKIERAIASAPPNAASAGNTR